MLSQSQSRLSLSILLVCAQAAEPRHFQRWLSSLEAAIVSGTGQQLTVHTPTRICDDKKITSLELEELTCILQALSKLWITSERRSSKETPISSYLYKSTICYSVGLRKKKHKHFICKWLNMEAVSYLWIHFPFPSHSTATCFRLKFKFGSC